MNEADWSLLCIPTNTHQPTNTYHVSHCPNKIKPSSSTLSSHMFSSEVKLCLLSSSFLLLGFSCSLGGGRVHRALFGLVGFWCKGGGGRTQQVRTTLDFLVPWVEACLHRHQMGDEKTGGHLVFKGIIIGLQPCTWCLATCPAGPNIGLLSNWGCALCTIA